MFAMAPVCLERSLSEKALIYFIALNLGLPCPSGCSGRTEVKQVECVGEMVPTQGRDIKRKEQVNGRMSLRGLERLEIGLFTFNFSTCCSFN